MKEEFGLVSSDKKTQISDQIQGIEKAFSLGYQKVRYPFDNKRAYQEVVLNISSFVSNAAEIYMNEKFHRSLKEALIKFLCTSCPAMFYVILYINNVCYIII